MLRGCLLLTLALATACSPPAAPEHPSGARPTALAAYVAVAAGPVGLATGADGGLWVVSARAGSVARVPAGATEPDLSVEVPGVPLRAVAAYGAVWVTAFEGRRLLRLDPGSGEVLARVRTGAGPEGVAAGFGSVWVVAQDAGRLLRVDPADDMVRETVRVGVGARLVTAGPDAVYVAHYADDVVLRVDPVSGAVARSERVCDGPQAMAVLDGRVWVTCTLSEELLALDATTLEVVARVPVAGSPDSVLATPDGRLAVVAEDGPRLVLVDPATAAVTRQTVLGHEAALGDRANLDLALAGGEAWVSSFSAARVYHLPLPG